MYSPVIWVVSSSNKIVSTKFKFKLSKLSACVARSIGARDSSLSSGLQSSSIEGTVASKNEERKTQSIEE